MSEYTAFAEQTVAASSNVLFTDAPIDNSCSIVHRAGSGIITLRGITRQCRARFRISFGANIAIPTGGTVEAISAAISVDGEALATSTMIVTPAAVENYTNNEVGGGLTTIFLFSTELAPSIPTANSIDISSGLVNDLDEG